MTVDEIAQKIYEERYAEPKHPEIAMYLRDGMVREVVQRTLELAIGNLADELVAARQARRNAHIVARESARARALDGRPTSELAPVEWDDFHRSEAAWDAVVTKLDAWIASNDLQRARAGASLRTHRHHAAKGSRVSPVGRKWKLWAHRSKNDALWHVGARRWVELHGLSDPLVPVLVEEILGDPYSPEVTHYGWQYAEGNQYRHGDTPTMIQIRTGSEPDRSMMFLAMCFPYGLDTAIAKGDGNVVAMRITERTAEAQE